MAGAIWTADRAHRRGLRPDGDCPCRPIVREDEDHLLWTFTAWKTVQDPLLPEIMLLARALKLGPLSEWPLCLRVCGLLPESVAVCSGLAQGTAWKKRCREPNRISRQQIPTRRTRTWGRGDKGMTSPWRGHRWVEEGKNPLEHFVHNLHSMFKAGLRARMQWEEEQNLLFPIQSRKVPWEEYPWYQLQGPRPGAYTTPLRAMGALSRD